MMKVMLTMHASDLGGHTLAGRYRITHPLAAGSSGRAYVAIDTQLGRKVAVKVLHEGLAADPGFLERFRAEARVVASLSHPNIVTLHDWGEDPLPFMVFELLEGGSLAGLLQTGARLDAAQAARLGAQVAAGLEHAHGRDLVHRDIKPANLLFDHQGNVKVADFGLARALAESGATEPVGGLIGTARYAAPEQATGETLDARADLYSLGLVLVEAVTGVVPLMGETAVATLTQRAATPLEAPVELGALGVVVERAALPLPVERYPDSAAMGRAIAAAEAMLPEAAPIAPAGLGVDLDEPEPTELARLVVPPPATDATEVAGEPEVVEAEPAVEHRRPGRWIPWVVGLAAGLALAGAAFAVNTARGPLVHAPNVVAQTEEAAGAQLAAAGLSLEVVDRVHTDDPAGTIVSQDPGPGDDLRRGGAVSVVVSDGAPPATLPQVVGAGEPDAVAALEAAGFEVAVEHRHHETVEAGKVALQEPSTTEAPKGSVVTVVVSDGPTPVIVPNVIGKSADEARAVLEGAGFAVKTAEEFSDTVDKGNVVRQDPVTGAEAVPGSEVTVVVSKGPNRVVIPDVRGLTVEEATKKIEAAGFEVDVVNYKPGALVKRQDPEGKLMLEPGRTVTLFM